MTEACGAVIERVKADGLPPLPLRTTGTIRAAARSWSRLGMRYQYSYEEQWQPKNIPVTFRMYQLNFHGKQDEVVYRKYWDHSAVHFVKTAV